MDIQKNLTLINVASSIRLEIVEAGYALVDRTWCHSSVCSPYSRLYYVTGGEGSLFIDGKEKLLTPGNAYLIPTGFLYDYRCRDSMEKLYFHVNVMLPNGFDLFYGLKDLSSIPMSPESFDQLKELFFAGDPESSIKLKGRLYEDTAAFAGKTGADAKIRQTYSRLLSQMFLLTQQPVSARNTVRSLAERLHVSESTLSKRFKQETGMTAGAYLEQVLMRKACQLLLATDYSLSRIAEELDFTDQFYFSRSFKHYTGVPPSVYRRTQKINEGISIMQE